MPEPLVVSISHRLGKAEARARLERGLEQIRGQVSGFVTSLDYRWNGDQLDFSVVAMRQTVTGLIDIMEDTVRVEIGLPWMLRLLTDKIVGRVRQQAQLLLESKPPNRT